MITRTKKDLVKNYLIMKIEFMHEKITSEREDQKLLPLKEEIKKNVQLSEIHGLINYAYDDIFGKEPINDIRASLAFIRGSQTLIYYIHDKSKKELKENIQSRWGILATPLMRFFLNWTYPEFSVQTYSIEVKTNHKNVLKRGSTTDGYDKFAKHYYPIPYDGIPKARITKDAFFNSSGELRKARFSTTYSNQSEAIEVVKLATKEQIQRVWNREGFFKLAGIANVKNAELKNQSRENIRRVICKVKSGY